MTQPIPKEQALSDIGIFAEYIAQLKPDPHCRVAGCWGRGFLGLQVVPSKDGPKVQLLLCKCGTIGETEYTRLMAEIGRVRKDISRLEMADLHDHAIITETLKPRTFFGAFEYIWGTIWRKKK